MSAEDGTVESSMMSSMFLASMVDSSRDGEDVLSSEELAWIDSCLTTDSDVLNSGWGYFKDALTEVISFQSQPSNITSTAEYDSQMLHSTDASKSRDLAAETTDDGHHRFRLTEEEADASPQADNDLSSLNNAFLPNYKEFPEEALVVDSDLLESLDIESSLSKDIFKVWDLDIPDEEDEFEKQLNKTFLSEGEDKDPLDKLVAGIADMSL